MKLRAIGMIALLAFSVSCKPASKEVTNSELPKEQQQGADVKLSSTAFKTATENQAVQLIDIRRPEEFADGHLTNALNIDFYDSNFITLMKAELDAEKPVYIYCRSGGRSGKAATQLSALGYKIYDLKGGILDWKAQNYELTKN